MTNPAGKSRGEVPRVDFDRRLMLQFRGSVVTSDAGLLAYLELDDALGLAATAGEMLADARTGKNGRHALAGYEDVNDAERLRHDPTMRWVGADKAALNAAASPSQMGRFETKWLPAEKNLTALTNLSGQRVDRVHARRPPRGVVLDMDSSVSPTHGVQKSSVWNGHYAFTCYHPLFLFNQFGDLERCALRPGNVRSADGWDSVLKPVVARYRGKVSRLYFPADAGFASPEVHEYLEAEGSKYVIRLPANRVLRERIGHLLKRPASRPSNDVCRCYANFTYQAGSWSTPRRVVAKAVRLQLHALAYSLGKFLRTLATPKPIKDWSMTTLQGETDQVRCEGRRSRALRRVPDDGGRYSTKSVRRYPMDHRRATAANGRVNGMKHSIVMRSPQTTGEARLDNGKPNILGRSARRWPAPSPVRRPCVASGLPIMPNCPKFGLQESAIRRTPAETFLSERGCHTQFSQAGSQSHDLAASAAIAAPFNPEPAIKHQRTEQPCTRVTVVHQNTGE